MAQRVFVLDKNEEPLMPCHPARARQLLESGKAAVYCRYPFTIILKDREGGETQPVQVKIDPGSQTTGIAVVAEFKRGLYCVWAGELNHRGGQIRDGLLSRRQLRRGRRNRKLRYRQTRFDNRKRPTGNCMKHCKIFVYPSDLVQVDAQNTIVRYKITPKPTRQRKKVYFGFQTGDIAKAIVTSGRKVGVYVGKEGVRAIGSFNITTATDTIQGIHYRFFETIHKSDGYSYMKGERALLPMPKGRGIRA